MGAGNEGVLQLAPFFRNLKGEKLTLSDLIQYTSFNAFYKLQYLTTAFKCVQIFSLTKF